MRIKLQDLKIKCKNEAKQAVRLRKRVGRSIGGAGVNDGAVENREYDKEMIQLEIELERDKQ